MTQEQLENWAKIAKAMVGKVPGKLSALVCGNLLCFQFGRLTERFSFFKSQSDQSSWIGLVSLEANAPLPISVPRAKGFDMGIVAVLEKPEDVANYATHPAHLE